ncbi:coiled-coil domain-containing protein 60-like isoform X2 [Dysidea avara]|uniref:coiled-coil domain-containing protein 60-like isoform X2 n=1 Tax=Dysidea avara TaxID=196820 RepID=UPI003317E0B0
MALVLCRPDKPPPPTDRVAQRVFLKYEPVPASPQQGGHIKARSELNYDTHEPERKEVFQENFKRRNAHLQAGFHGPCEKSYREVGEVVLNNKKLFQEALGQDGGRSLTPPQNEVSYEELKKLPLSAGKLQLRAKTPAQFPEQLVSLKEQLKRENACLEASRRGFGLFKLLSDVEHCKRNKAEKEAKVEAQRLLYDWRPPSPTDDESRDLASSTRRLFSVVSHPRVSAEDKGNRELDGSQVVMNIESATPSRTQSPMESDPCNEGDSVPGEVQSSIRGSVFLHIPDEEQPSLDEQVTKDMERDNWYYQLCVLEWVLHAMQLSSVHHMPPFSKCWNVEMHSTPGVFASSTDRKPGKYYDQQWDQFVRGGAVKKAANVKGRVNTGSRFARSSRPAQQQSTVHQSSHHLMAAAASSSLSTQKSRGTSDVSSIPEVPSEQEQNKNAQVWASPSNLAQISAQPYVPKSPPTIPFAEEKKAKRQKRLTPDQLKALESLVDEEFVYSKRQNKNRLKALLKEADERRVAEEMEQSTTAKVDFPQLMFDLPTIKQKFGGIEEGRNMIVHEQLSAMQKNRLRACQQKFSALKMTGKYWDDIDNMRESVSMETTAMAKKKLLMNYYWYEELDAQLPDHVKSDQYCKILLANLKILATYMCQVGPKHMSKKKLIKVLGSLKPWELRAPLVAATIKFIITKVIYIVEEDYQQWLENHAILCDTIQLRRRPH